MHKTLTALAAGTFALCGLHAHAQITLDGVVNANEIGERREQIPVAWARSRPRTLARAGFGFAGLLRMYAATSSTKLYVALAGTIEAGNNNFQLYLDLPGRTGVVAGTALPDIAGNGTAFATSSTDPNKTIGGTKMDMDVDAAIALTGAGDVQAAVFSSATSAVAKSIGGGAAILTDGSPNTTSGATGTYALFGGTRVAYLASPGNITTNPGEANGGGAGSFAVEYEFSRTALGITSSASVVHLMAAYVSPDGYWSSDVIPEIPGNGNANLELQARFHGPGRHAVGHVQRGVEQPAGRRGGGGHERVSEPGAGRIHHFVPGAGGQRSRESAGVRPAGPPRQNAVQPAASRWHPRAEGANRRPGRRHLPRERASGRQNCHP